MKVKKERFVRSGTIKDASEFISIEYEINSEAFS